MFEHLQIPYRQERVLVGLADAGLAAAKRLGWPRTARDASARAPRRILLLRLERVGDLVMVLEAIAMVRAMAPEAAIDLVVGSWNRVARRPDSRACRSKHSMCHGWRARERGLSWTELVKRAHAWRRKDYDLAINFEPDIRSNLLIALSGARRRAGFVSGGGGAVLTDAIAPDPHAHIADECEGARRACIRTKSAPSAAQTDFPSTSCNIPGRGAPQGGRACRHAHTRRSARGHPARRRPAHQGMGSCSLCGSRRRLARTRGASVVLIGSDSDKPVVDAVRAAWPGDVPVVELPADIDLVLLAAVLERLTLFITGDTGPMHLAAAVDTPVLAIFGPSLPTRYAPLSARSRIVRIDITAAPAT